MSYQVNVPFESKLAPTIVAKYLQQRFDNGVDGSFVIQSAPIENQHLLVFMREAGDDIEYIQQRMPKDKPVTDAVLAMAVGTQLWLELTDENYDEAIEPVLAALRCGNFTVGNLSGIRSLLTPNKLFTVTLDWNPNKAEEGDYQVKKWAVDADAAILATAEEMASESGLDEALDAIAYRQFVDNLVAGASGCAAEEVGSRVVYDIHALLAGPDEKLTDAARTDLATIKAILAQYGVVAN